MNRAVLTSAKSGNPKDRERLLLDFDGLIRSIAKSYASRIEGAESLEDLIQVGRIGFLDALDRFDENIAPAFIPYAKEGVRMAIRDHLNKAMRLIRLPKSAIENVKVLSEAYSELQEEGEAMPQREKVLEKTGFTERKLKNAERNWKLQMPMSLDYQYGDDNTLSDLIDSGVSEEERADTEMLIDKLHSSLSSLSIDDRFLINSLYGSFGAKKLKPSDIAAKLSISVGAVRNRQRRIECSLYRAIS